MRTERIMNGGHIKKVNFTIKNSWFIVLEGDSLAESETVSYC